MKKLIKSLLPLIMLLVASLASAQVEPEKSIFTYASDWWNGGTASGKWFGLKPVVEDYGLRIYGRWHGTYYGNVSGGLKRAGAFDESLHILGDLDFAKLTGWEGLEGLIAHGSVRYRDGYNINNYVGATGAYNPSTYQGGRQWRLLPFFLTYTTPELFGMRDFLTVSGGWHNPYLVFGIQPGANFVRNNIYTNKGLGANGVLYSSSYAAWGGYMRVRPTDWHYTMAGLFLAIPGGTSTDNHGLAFAGAHPAYRNGIWAIGETALTPKIGPSKLPGKYAFGGYYFGLKNTDFQGQPREGRYGFYWQVDQMLWREPIPTLPPPPIADGKTIQPSKNVKTVVPTSKLSDQGLSFFAWFNYAPKYNNIMPFYFHTGLIYKGLIPTRDEDQIGAGIAYSNYSIDQIRMVESRGGNPLTYQAEVEFDYRIQVNKWAYVQPFLQYLIRPAANTTVHNATVLGVNVGINF